MMCYNI